MILPANCGAPGAEPGPAEDAPADGDSAEAEDGHPRTADGSPDDQDRDQDEADERFSLPAAVRRRVVSLAADALGALAPEEIPGSLRAVARFAPGRRAKLALTPIGAALEADPAFRERIADRLRNGVPDLAAALEAGRPPPAADPRDVAAAAYLLRPPGWRAYVAEVHRQEEQAQTASAKAAADASLERLHEELAAARGAVKAGREHHHAELAERAAEVDELRRQLRSAHAALRRAEASAKQAHAEAAELRAAASESALAAEGESRRLRGRLAEVESALEASRRLAREDRNFAEVRLRLLLDTLLDATQGLRRELALPPVTEMRPADTVPAAQPAPGGDLAPRALAGDDPALLDELLALPQVHLVIDGYNVTKSGYPTLPLIEQRMRLLSGLAVLAAQTGAEITCVFDGADVAGIVSAAPRGVRVLFSRPGETADELIRRLVRAEPPGRPIVVVSSDREVADGVRRSGARAVPSAMLLRRLARA